MASKTDVEVVKSRGWMLGKEMGTMRASKAFGVPRSMIRGYSKICAKWKNGEGITVVRNKLDS